MPLSLSIELSVPSVRERVRARGQRMRAWFASLLPYALPNYERTREEMGGVPWRRFEKSDTWFVSSAESLAAIPDTGATPRLDSVDEVPNLRPSWSRTKTIVVTSLGLSSCLLVILALGGPVPKQAVASVAVAPVAVVTSAAPFVPVAHVAPARVPVLATHEVSERSPVHTSKRHQANKLKRGHKRSPHA